MDSDHALGATQLARWSERREELCRAHYLWWGDICPAAPSAVTLDQIRHVETHSTIRLKNDGYNLAEREEAVPTRGQEARAWGLYLCRDDAWLPDWMLDSVALKVIADAQAERQARQV